MKPGSVWFQKPCSVQSKMFLFKLFSQNYMMRDNRTGYKTQCQCTGLCLNRILESSPTVQLLAQTNNILNFFSFVASLDLFHILNILTKLQFCFLFLPWERLHKQNAKRKHNPSKEYHSNVLLNTDMDMVSRLLGTYVRMGHEKRT